MSTMLGSGETKERKQGQPKTGSGSIPSPLPYRDSPSSSLNEVVDADAVDAVPLPDARLVMSPTKGLPAKGLNASLQASLHIPFELQQLLNRIEANTKFGRLKTERFLEYFNKVIDKAIAIEGIDDLTTQSTLSGSITQDNNTFLHIFRLSVDEDEVEEEWMKHPVFFRAEWLRKYLEKHYELGKTDPLIHPMIFKKCIESLLELIKTQIKGESYPEETDKQILLRLKMLHAKGNATFKFAETAFKLIPKLLSNYIKLYYEVIEKLKKAIEQYDEQRCKEVSQNAVEQLTKNVKQFQQQRPSYSDMTKTITALQSVNSEVNGRVEDETVIYDQPKILFKGRESSSDYNHLMGKTSVQNVEGQSQLFAADVKTLSDEVQCSVPTSRSFIFNQKNILPKATGARILLPKKGDDSILILPPVIIDPIFLELEDKRYANIVMYYEYVNNNFNVEVYLKYDQEKQYKIYHFVKELPFAPDVYAPIFPMWFNGRVSKPDDKIQIVYSSKSILKKNLRGGYTETPIGAGSYPHLVEFEGRYLPAVPYAPMRKTFFEGLKKVPIKNFEQIKQHAQEILKARMRKEWEKCCLSLSFKACNNVEDPQSLFQMLNALDAHHLIIESILYFCFGQIFEKSEIFKCFREAGVHKNRGDFIKFLTSSGQDGTHLMQLETLAKKLLQGSERIQRMQVKPDMPFLAPILEFLKDSCIGAYEMRVQLAETKGGMEEQLQLNGGLQVLKTQLAALQVQLAAIKEEQTRFHEETRTSLATLLTEKWAVSSSDMATAEKPSVPYSGPANGVVSAAGVSRAP